MRSTLLVSSAPELVLRAEADFEFHPAQTSIAKYLLGRIDLIHRYREMGAFAGPPGLGKTTVIDLIERKLPGNIVRVTPRQERIKAGSALRLAVNAIRRHNGAQPIEGAITKDRLQVALDRSIGVWAERAWEAQGCEGVPHLTLIFDESQRFLEECFETLRGWNDKAWSDHLPPVALVFVGNAKFVLETGAHGASFLSEAVKSRTSYWKAFEYHHLTDDDLRLVIEANDLVDHLGVKLLLEYCDESEFNRDLRVVMRIIRDAKRHARGGSPKRSHVLKAIGGE